TAPRGQGPEPVRVRREGARRSVQTHGAGKEPRRWGRRRPVRTATVPEPPRGIGCRGRRAVLGARRSWVCFQRSEVSCTESSPGVYPLRAARGGRRITDRAARTEVGGEHVGQRWEADISRASTSFSPPWLRDSSGRALL